MTLSIIILIIILIAALILFSIETIPADVMLGARVVFITRCITPTEAYHQVKMHFP